MNAGRSDVCFFVYCLRVVDVFNDDNFFAQTEVTMFITRSACFALFLNFPLYNWLRYYFIAFIQFIIPYEVRECSCILLVFVTERLTMRNDAFFEFQ